MALSRNARRAITRQRKEAKLERTIKRATAYRNHVNRLIVDNNLRSPVERNYYPTRSCLADMPSQSHRAYICRG